MKRRLAIYQAERPFCNLYVHLDKNNYLTNESIWFKAYLLSGTDLQNKVLFVRVKDADKKVVLSAQFPMYDVRAHGDILLPDTLKEGEYFFYAFTNSMLNLPAGQVFVQKIRIFKNNADNMEAEAGVTDSAKLRRGSPVDILVKLKKGNRYVTDVKGSYRLLVDDKPVKAGKITTNFLGEAFISFTYPQITDDQTLKVQARFTKDDDVADLNLNLRHEASPVIVKVWPEGGHLVAGVDNHVVVEAGDNKGNPLPTALILKDGDKVMARLQTNGYGIAQFNFIPQSISQYHFEVPGNTNKTPIAFTASIEPGAWSLQVIKAGNGFSALIHNQSKSDSCTLVLRSYDEVLWRKMILVEPGGSAHVDIPAAQYPRAVLSLALFNSRGLVTAERLLMNRQNEQIRISVQTDKPGYGQRQKVKVTISAEGEAGNPILANLSAAVVEKTRISAESYTTILDNYYYKPLSRSFADQHYSNAGANDLDAILTGKTWYGSDWASILNYKPKGYRKMFKSADGVSGQITSLKNKPLALKSLIMLSKNSIDEIPLTPEGTFYIPPESLTAQAGEKKYLMLNQDFYDKYAIKLNDYEGEYDNIVTYSGVFRFPDAYNTMVKLNDKTGINLKGTIQLHEVKIQNQVKTLGLSFDGRDFTSKTCNDYVCLYNILNCPNHKFGNPPVDGGIYTYQGHQVVYHGCASQVQPNHFLLKNISTPNNFILPDYDKDPSNEPELRSTVYWSPNLNTGKDGKVSFEFFTSDIKGDFTIMVQGVNAKTLRPVYATGTLVVK
ncbi:hypothetical protein BEL04_12155 [Mucilaginibacter sp. PPCGB 2223]|nr:hypothetical protein BEL04_12155 [Mucilaginibacter sp. PPCGB 2223]